MRVVLRILLPAVLVAGMVPALLGHALLGHALADQKAVPEKKSDARPAEVKPAATRPAEKKPAESKAVADEETPASSATQRSTEKDQQRFFVTAKDFAADVHWQKGMRCQDCHGGDPTVFEIKSHQAKEDFRVVKSPADVPEFCGTCHANIEYMRHYQPSPRTDQLSEYWTSGHGQRLKASGDPEGGHLHFLSRQAAWHGRRPGQARDSCRRGPAVARVSHARGQDVFQMPFRQGIYDRPSIPRQAAALRSVCQVENERSRPGAAGEGRPERRHLQQLPRQPRRRTAPGGQRGQCLRRLPREDRQAVCRHPHEAPVRRGGASRLRHLSWQP